MKHGCNQYEIRNIQTGKNGVKDFILFLCRIIPQRIEKKILDILCAEMQKEKNSYVNQYCDLPESRAEYRNTI